MLASRQLLNNVEDNGRWYEFSEDEEKAKEIKRNHFRDVGVVRVEKVCLAVYGKYFGLS